MLNFHPEPVRNWSRNGHGLELLPRTGVVRWR